MERAKRMSKPSPVPGFPEHQCYAFARRMVDQLGRRPKRSATDQYLTRISKPISLQPYQVRMIARFYWKTFAVEPYGEKVRIILR